MSKTFMPDVDLEERKELLKGNADDIEQTKYYKDLTPEELDIKREAFTENSIQLSQWEDELDEVKARYKSFMKPVKESNSELLSHIKTRKELVEGTLYHIADQEDRIMNTYDETGEFVSSRRLRPDERQTRILHVPLRKTAEDSE